MANASPDGKATVYVRLPAHLIRAIDEAADVALVSRSAIIRSAVAKVLAPKDRHAPASFATSVGAAQ